MLQSVNPYTGTVIGEFREPSDEALRAMVSDSSSAFSSWRLTGFNYRRTLMEKVADLLIANADEYSILISSEMGKPAGESKAEAEKCAWVCRYYANNGEDFLRAESFPTDAWSSYVRYEPLGPILGIMPWNFPFWQVFRFAVPTLMAGNTVLLKHASNVQGCALALEEIFRKAGFPEAVFTNLPIGSSRVASLIENDAIKGISLTGSEAAGQEVARIAGYNIKKCVLELGGSNAFIVLADADLEEAALTGARARMMNGGQSCIAAKRFILHKDISDRFLNLFLENIADIKSGDPIDVNTRMGPLASVHQAEIVERQVNESVGLGARILTGGTRNRAFYSPTVLTGVHPGMPVFDEEVFGPVAPVMTARDDDEAVALARSSKYGLGVSLFTNDMEKAEKMAGSFGDGAVFINDLVKSDPRLPFGGTGRSGYGRELSRHGIREFVNVKTIYAKRL